MNESARVRSGLLAGGDSDYGIEVYDETGTKILGADGLGLEVVGTANIADAAIERAKIAALAVGSAEIDDLAVGTIKIEDAAVNRVTSTSAATVALHTNTVNGFKTILSFSHAGEGGEALLSFGCSWNVASGGNRNVTLRIKRTTGGAVTYFTDTFLLTDAFPVADTAWTAIVIPVTTVSGTNTFVIEAENDVSHPSAVNSNNPRAMLLEPLK